MGTEADADSETSVQWVNRRPTADPRPEIPSATSPIEEADGFELGVASSTSTEQNSVMSRAIPLQLSSSSDYDGDVSDNPSFSGRLHNSHSNRSTGAVDINMSRVDDPSSFLGNERSSSAVSRYRSSSLPADDGMGHLRQRIISIQSMEIPVEQKARMMHLLLTQRYKEAQKPAPAKQEVLVPLLEGRVSQETPAEPVSLSSFIWQMNGMVATSNMTEQPVFQLSKEDLERSYALRNPVDLNDSTGDIATRSESGFALGCRHYKRNVKLQCSDCDRWYTCRLCHDEVEDHLLDRKATKNMLCMICGCAQKAGEFCAVCGERTAWYYCAICKLWDNDASKTIYHCNDCGICRKGRGLGKDFFHCKTCGTCMSTSVEHSHKCIERVSDCDCPICGEYMFTSPQTVVFMPCGHSIHYACYYEHMRSSYKCPICSKSAVNMETQFRNLDRAIDSQPMPPHFQDTKAMVLCNDCHAKSAVKYHWLGLKCAICDSYNTAQLSIMSSANVEVSTVAARGFEHTDALPDSTMGGEAPIRAEAESPRSRRHSLHTFTLTPALSIPGSIDTYPTPHRFGRSMSPPRGLRTFDTSLIHEDTDDTAGNDDEELDFWGIEELRSVTSAEIAGDDIEADDEDSGSVLSDCALSGDDGEYEEDFALVGHR